MHGTARVNGRRKNVGLGADEATHRMFVAERRTELVYQVAATYRALTAAFQPVRRTKR